MKIPLNERIVAETGVTFVKTFHVLDFDILSD